MYVCMYVRIYARRLFGSQLAGSSAPGDERRVAFDICPVSDEENIGGTLGVRWKGSIQVVLCE